MKIKGFSQYMWWNIYFRLLKQWLLHTSAAFASQKEHSTNNVLYKKDKIEAETYLKYSIQTL